MDLGPHAAFIWISYAVVTVVVTALIAWLITDGNKLARQRDDLEKRGLGRRTTKTKS